MTGTVAALGRFQPFHWGHLEYLVETARHGQSLLIGITNPTPEQTRRSDSDSIRSATAGNPFSYEERRQMISRGLTRLASGIAHGFSPCDLRSPALLRASLGDCDLVAVTIYDSWGEEKKTVIESAGYEVLVLWRRSEKLVTGTEVRRRLRRGLDWEHLVPPGTVDVLRGLPPLADTHADVGSDRR